MSNIVRKPETAVDSTRRLHKLSDKASDFLAAGLSTATRKAYAGHWTRFLDWCSENNLDSTPGSKNIVPVLGLYITHLADTGKKISTIEQALAAVALAHTSSDLPNPNKHQKIRKLIKGMKNTIGVAPVKKKAISLQQLRHMVNKCPPTLKGRRDRALLLIGFLGAFRRSELVAIRVEDIQAIKNGIRIHVVKSKTDQQRKGRFVSIPKGKTPSFCPVAALVDWLKASKIKKGPVFRRTLRSGGVGANALSGTVVATTVKQYTGEIGLAVDDFAGHSLRAGFVTAAAKNGAKDWEIMKTTGHKNVQTLHGYIQTGDGLENNPARNFDL